VGPKEHFKNTLEWLLNLKPDADEALQIAAYCHDIERVNKKPGAKRFLIYDDPGMLREHQEVGGQTMYDFLIKNGAPEELAERVKHLISYHEDGGDEDQNLLKDADSISYLEVNAPKHLKEGIFSEQEMKEKFNFMFDRITSETARELAKPFYNRAISDLKIDME
jgi:hypothetical protein